MCPSKRPEDFYPREDFKTAVIQGNVLATITAGNATVDLTNDEVEPTNEVATAASKATAATVATNEVTTAASKNHSRNRLWLCLSLDCRDQPEASDQ